MPELLKTDKLNLIEEKLQKCFSCGISRSRTKLVFGSGNPDARLMFIGEAPGRDEDLQGKPFVGRAGQLLTKIIESIGLKREEVYIANILKCRPPNNRPPEPDEINNCEQFLKQQIEIIRPRIICALGRIAAQSLLKTQTPISKLRGNFFTYENIKLIPTYHPAYLLRNPPDKIKVWEDMKKIKQELDNAPKEKPREDIFDQLDL
ncbi:MAG: uracil-DNA glycosylase, partial [bacterium]|nr:uracil-DNA glycosylase [bacterium]